MHITSLLKASLLLCGKESHLFAQILPWSPYTLNELEYPKGNSTK